MFTYIVTQFIYSCVCVCVCLYVRLCVRVNMCFCVCVQLQMIASVFGGLFVIYSSLLFLTDQ